MNKKEIIGFIGGMLAIVTIVFGAYFYIDKRYALAEEVRQFRQQYDYDKTVNFLKQTEGRIYVIKERHGEKPINKTIKEELSRLEQDAQELRSKIKVMEKK